MITQGEIERYAKLRHKVEKAENTFAVVKAELGVRLKQGESQEAGKYSLIFTPYIKSVTRYKEVVEKIKDWLKAHGSIKVVKILDGYIAEASHPIESQYMDVRIEGLKTSSAK